MTQVSSILRVDRVRETCTASSPGTYSLTGATLGYGTFSANLPDGSIIEYGVTQTAGASWEYGIGIYHSDTNTVTVTTVTSSSNAGSPIAWTGQSITIFVSLNAAGITEIQNSSFVYSIIFG